MSNTTSPVHVLALALPCLLALACSTTISPARGGPTPETSSTEARGEVGNKCTTACGGTTDLDCAVPTSDCGAGWCLVDIKSTGSLRTYCTASCASGDCPAGFHCGAIDVIGIDGIQKGCIADPAVCGDDVHQLGETCEKGETSAEGMCRSDCTGWESTHSCGDGKVDADEECEKDTDKAYCVACKLASPELVIGGLTTRLTSERWGPAVVTHQGSDSGAQPLVTKGSASDCGRYAIVENNAEVVRIELTSCDAKSKTRATWTIAVPRTTKELGTSAEARWLPTAKLEQMSGGGVMTYATLSAFSASFVSAPDHRIVAISYDAELTHYAVGGGGKAYLELQLGLLPPPP